MLAHAALYELFSRVLFLTEVEAPATLIDRWQDDLLLCGKTLERARDMVLARRRDRTQRTYVAQALILARRLKHITAELEFLREAGTVKAQLPAASSAGSSGPRPASVPTAHPRVRVKG